MILQFKVSGIRLETLEGRDVLKVLMHDKEGRKSAFYAPNGTDIRIGQAVTLTVVPKVGA
jgi:hypothetical protein